ncbi:WavE lipopolysaccharide synthesis family protein [Cognatiyoonia sp. IB215182]|uniref:WavE lipopolysaccharide synthesis family protein n=1 Tax=Cognatiyoonia sp. IB215182 TaxID=3097353 RepID=UPI002A0BECDE|nr:WavE lipopolysaccharide synthesis family protein [Cognatiyoonia sp. IB215182]MDX8353096.1 WavE lipopolysaccharide synthesis family protein [Cognatiyoonia sp. IB215182]
MTKETAKKDLVTRIGNKVAQRLLDGSVRWLNKRSDTYSTYRQRPKFAAQLGTQRDRPLNVEKMAIVMQGPLPVPDNFAYETMAIYRRHMPGVQLILSTWADTPEEHLAPMRDLGVEVVPCEKPDVAGLFNINMQLVSAGAGIKKAVEDGATWVMKTRVDQRLYNPNIMAELASMAKSFPVMGGFDQKHRIFGIGYGSLKYAPYHVTDQTVFGHADDMLKYWTPPLRENEPPAHFPKTAKEIYTQIPIGEECRLAAPESYIASQFLARIGRELDWSVQDTWAAYRDSFCFVDYQTTDFFWQKTQTWSRLELMHAYDKVWTRHEVTFAHWMLLYSGTLAPEAAARYEGALDQLFMSAIDIAD